MTPAQSVIRTEQILSDVSDEGAVNGMGYEDEPPPFRPRPSLEVDPHEGEEGH